MSIIEAILIAIGLAMDAFAVSLCKGLQSGRICVINFLKCGFWFGIFQAVMSFIGYIVASVFTEYIQFITPWISFALLSFLGIKMIIEGVKGDSENSSENSYAPLIMLMLAVATSIDALAVGITFAFNGVTFVFDGLSNIWIFVAIIGIASFVISALGNIAGGVMGQVIGKRFGNMAEIIGGIILLGLGIKFLVGGILEFF